jgi:hypothetical protein
VSIGGTLVVGAATTVVQVPTLLGYVGTGGTLDVSTSTAILALTPSAAVTSFSSAVGGGKTLKIKADAEETLTTLTVPAGLDLTNTKTLATVTALTVNGALTAGSAT